MPRDFQILPTVTLIFVISLFTSTTVTAQEELLRHIQLPPGFAIEMFAENVPNARSLAVGEKGTVFVGTRVSPGKVYALTDSDGDFKADKVRVIAQGLRAPNGVALKDGDLYVAEISRVWRYNDIEDHLDDIPEPELLLETLPTDSWHGWKYIDFGPDGLLYIPIGAPCNVCLKDDPRYASMLRWDPASGGQETEIFAKGIRNTVGFDWHPETGELWFTDNGRDWLGDNLPPDELNHAPGKDMHFGFPYCHGQTVSDPEYGEQRSCDEFTPAAQNLGPHVAALGMKFYTGEMFPEEYLGQIFITEHGSWNRSTKIGYRVMLVELEGDEAVSYKVFAEGWLVDGRVWGRPVDVELLADGSMLVSDDHGGRVYRIRYKDER